MVNRNKDQQSLLNDLTGKKIILQMNPFDVVAAAKGGDDKTR
jgi:hypothetical protein